MLAAAVAFVSRFLVADKWQDFCDIAAFALIRDVCEWINGIILMIQDAELNANK